MANLKGQNPADTFKDETQPPSIVITFATIFDLLAVLIMIFWYFLFLSQTRADYHLECSKVEAAEEYAIMITGLNPRIRFTKKELVEHFQNRYGPIN